MLNDNYGPPLKQRRAPHIALDSGLTNASPSTSLMVGQFKRVDRIVGPMVRPLILRGTRKRQQVQHVLFSNEEQLPIYIDESNLLAISPVDLDEQERIAQEGDAYVQQLTERMAGRFDSLVFSRKVSASQQSDSSVRKRLSSRNDCDLRALCCCVSLCGRSFDSVQVLAWHMSYAHQDVSVPGPYNRICYLCGFTMSTAKGKNAHLTTKHRLVAERHNMECIEQRGSIIAPGAPAAERLRRKEVHMKAVAAAAAANSNRTSATTSKTSKQQQQRNCCEIVVENAPEKLLVVDNNYSNRIYVYDDEEQGEEDVDDDDDDNDDDDNDNDNDNNSETPAASENYNETFVDVVANPSTEQFF